MRTINKRAHNAAEHMRDKGMREAWFGQKKTFLNEKPVRLAWHIHSFTIQVTMMVTKVHSGNFGYDFM